MSTLREVILLIIGAYSLHLAQIVAYFKSKSISISIIFYLAWLIFIYGRCATIPVPDFKMSG